jgi:hypothetical protein
MSLVDSGAGVSSPSITSRDEIECNNKMLTGLCPIAWVGSDTAMSESSRSIISFGVSQASCFAREVNAVDLS